MILSQSLVSRNCRSLLLDVHFALTVSRKFYSIIWKVRFLDSFFVQRRYLFGVWIFEYFLSRSIRAENFIFEKYYVEHKSFIFYSKCSKGRTLLSNSAIACFILFILEFSKSNRSKRISRIFFPRRDKNPKSGDGGRISVPSLSLRKKKSLNKKGWLVSNGFFGFSSTPRPSVQACKNTVDVCFCPGDLPSAISTPMNNKSTLPHYARASLHFLQPRDRISMISYHHSHPAKVNFFFSLSLRNRDGRRGNTRDDRCPFFSFFFFMDRSSIDFFCLVKHDFSKLWRKLTILKKISPLSRNDKNIYMYFIYTCNPDCTISKLIILSKT